MASGFYKRGIVPDIPDQDELKSLLRSTPYIINHMLYRSSASRADYEENTYLDHFIFQSGKKLNKKVVGLEKFAVSQKLANLAQEDDPDSDNEEKKEERERKRLILKEIRKDMSYSEAIEDAYRRGDLDMLDTLEKLNGSPEHFFKYMLYDRNQLMVDCMDSIMKKSRLFAGVGSAHLPGSQGMIEMLRRKGYTLRPVKFADNNSIKMKANIDAIRVPVKFTTQFAGDSAFSVDLPYQLHETATFPAGKDYLSMDMGNGSYYYIQRLNHYGGLKGKKADYFIKRIDSLLYENIPGKIISKKNVTSNAGYPGYDIVNKTSKGDMQRYHIFITPEEIYVFKMSGVEEYVTQGPEADKFFNSIAFRTTRNGGKRRCSDAATGVQIDFPGQFSDLRAQFVKSAQQRYVTGFSPDGNSYCFFAAASLIDFSYLEEDTFELSIMADVFAKQTDLTVKEKKVTTLGKWPALDVVFEHEGQKIYGRLALRGHRYYLAGCRGDEKTAQEFIQSFTFTDFKLNEKLQTYTDTSMHFSVNTFVNTSQYRDVSESASREVKKKKKDEEEIFLPKSRAKYFQSPESGEIVAVAFRKFSMYYQEETMEKFWKGMVEDMDESRQFHWRQTEMKKDGEWNIMSGMLTDTGCSRGFMMRVYQRCGSVHIVRALIDTIEGPSPFVNNFFETFRPKDTCMGIDVLSDKLSEYFFPKIYDTDTTISKPAKKAIRYVSANLLDKHVPQMITMIKNPKFGTLDKEDKQRLIKALGRRKSPDILPFLEKLYIQYTDSQKLAFSVLNAVAKQMNKKATQTFLNLMRTELCVTSDESSIRDAFSPFFDSLEMARPLFPAILSYTRFPEYRPTIYELQSKMMEKNILKSKDYAKQQNDILEDANYELKIYLSSIDNSRYSSNYRTFPPKSDNSNYAYRMQRRKFDPADALNDRQEDMLRYVQLLAPFHHDKRVKKFLDKVLTNTPDELRIVAAGLMLKLGAPVNDSTWNKYAVQRSKKALVYATLSYYGHLEKMKPELLKQEELLQALLFSEDTKGKSDTIVQLEKVPMKNKLGEGYAYVYKWRPKDKKIWKLAVSGIHPNDQNQVTLYPEVHRTSIAFESDQQKKKEVDNALLRLRIYGHRRASVSDFEVSSAGGYDMFEDF
ncbi:MAG: GumN family protein [Bacteroidetes bacterium]|nr:MAG: GumN family protein [Bacteroidota bacterium]